jgi:hypothetical protein
MRIAAIGRRSIVPLIVLAGASFGMVSARAFVPSCEKELAEAYPSLLKGDLSACNEPAGPLPAVARADLARFARQLQGTWRLDNRTIHGISIDTSGRQARIFFDLEAVQNARAVGTALLLDQPGTTWNGQASKAAFWGVGIGQPDAARVALRMKGEALGSYSYARIRDIDEAPFVYFKKGYVSWDRTSSAPAWDKIVLLEGSLTYVSCSAGVVERYMKVSGDKPAIDGLSLQSFWTELKANHDPIATRQILARPGAERRGR